MTQAYPLAWPVGWRRCTARKRAQFKTGERRPDRTYMSYKDISIAEGVKRVVDELSRLGVRRGDAIISTNLKVRLDGLPYSDQREPADPGVAVYWRRKDGEPMKVMAIDRYDRVADNLAAVAATLDAMRAIERHGGGEILERTFTGFEALPPPRGWPEILGIPPNATREQVNEAFRRLAGEHHPDRGGSHDRMSEISRARDEALKQVTSP